MAMQPEHDISKPGREHKPALKARRLWSVILLTPGFQNLTSGIRQQMYTVLGHAVWGLKEMNITCWIYLHFFAALVMMCIFYCLPV